MVEKVNKVNLKNITKHLTKLTTQAIEKAFDIKDFPTAVAWSQTGSSDLSSPSALKIYNMNCRKEGWKFDSIKAVAEEIIKNLPKDDMIKEVKITALISEDKGKKDKKEDKKDDKKDDKKKDKKVKTPPPTPYYLDYILSDDFLIKTAKNVLQDGKINIESDVIGRKVLVDFS